MREMNGRIPNIIDSPIGIPISRLVAFCLKKENECIDLVGARDWLVNK